MGEISSREDDCQLDGQRIFSWQNLTEHYRVHNKQQLFFTMNQLNRVKCLKSSLPNRNSDIIPT
jgi:hypothetical protein